MLLLLLILLLTLSPLAYTITTAVNQYDDSMFVKYCPKFSTVLPAKYGVFVFVCFKLGGWGGGGLCVSCLILFCFVLFCFVSSPCRVHVNLLKSMTVV